jgi:hypothetical protein
MRICLIARVEALGEPAGLTGRGGASRNAAGRSEKCVCRQTADAKKILLVACQTFPPRYGNSGINHPPNLGGVTAH